MNPASITVLHVSELLSMIFANLLEDDKDTLVSAACTCKCWWPVALDVLYETMDLKDLLALLAPVSFEAIYTDIDDDESMMSEVRKNSLGQQVACSPHISFNVAHSTLY